MSKIPGSIPSAILNVKPSNANHKIVLYYDRSRNCRDTKFIKDITTVDKASKSENGEITQSEILALLKSGN